MYSLKGLSKGYILYGSMYKTFWKMENYRNRNKSVEPEERVDYEGAEQENFSG